MGIRAQSEFNDIPVKMNLQVSSLERGITRIDALDFSIFLS